MTIDVVKLAKAAGDDWDHTLPEDKEFLARFAALVIEECAKKCEGILDGWPVSNEGTLMKEMCVAAIRQMKGTT